MTLFHAIIYTPWVNKFLRNVNYVLAPLLPSGIRLHPSGIVKLHAGGNLSFKLRTNQTSYVARDLFWKKPSNFEYSSLFIELARKVDVFIDVGANIGYYSILGCMANPTLKVIAFEPSTGAMIYMCENLKLNNLLNRVVVEPKALSNATGKIKFYEIRNLKFPTIYNLSGEHNIGTKKDRPTHNFFVEAISLDEYVKNQGIKKIDLIKLDTEGAEAMILRGSLNTIRTQRPIIICETLYNKIESELESIMLEHQYDFYNHFKEGLKKVETLIRKNDDGIRNCFFVPKEKTNKIEEWIL